MSTAPNLSIVVHGKGFRFICPYFRFFFIHTKSESNEFQQITINVMDPFFYSSLVDCGAVFFPIHFTKWKSSFFTLPLCPYLHTKCDEKLKVPGPDIFVGLIYLFTLIKVHDLYYFHNSVRIDKAAGELSTLRIFAFSVYCSGGNEGRKSAHSPTHTALAGQFIFIQQLLIIKMNFTRDRYSV